MTSAEEFNCLFCKETFDSKEELQVHFRKHGDPKFNQSVKNKSQSEMAASGDKDDGEVVTCDVCEEVFPTISKAITHKHKMHPEHEAKYFCPWCGKLFTMKHLYNKHIQTTHDSKEQSEETGFHCDYCEVDFFIPSAMIYHNKFFHRQDTELAAIGHSKKLKMYKKEPLQVYYCPFCGEEYCNKVNLHKHMGDDHIDENQCPEDILRCPLCEAVFYHLDAYELHLTFHSVDDQYSEDNELLKEITEFSLETVPPMMEKVENESQEDEPAESIGIEELLQQGMNESNDNDISDEPRKKKKHKKHKKSKKTITLDEFLNMHSDVLGEGLDVEGIVEVPSQVVTKQLRKPHMPKGKPGPKQLPSAELAKLKKAGIVIKKKPTPFQGMKVGCRKQIANTAQVGSKIKPSVQIKPDVKTSSNYILSKLLNQTNSQIKIVKKSAGGNAEDNILTASKKTSENKESLACNDNENSVISKENGDFDGRKSEGQKEDSPTDNKEQEVEACLSQDLSQNTDNQCSTKVGAKLSQVSKEDECTSKEFVEEENKKEEKAESPNIGKNTYAISALRNISQHITIKSLSSPSSVQTNQEPLAINQTVSDKETTYSDTEADLAEDSHEKKQLDSKTIENCNKHPALKHLSHLTVKSANQSQIITSPEIIKKVVVEKNIADTENVCDNFDTDTGNGNMQEENKNEMHIVNSTVVKDITNTKNTATKLDALKSLSKHITVKSLSQSPQSAKHVIDKLDKNFSDDEEFDVTDTNVNKNSSKIVKTHNTVTSSPTVMKTGTNLKSPGIKPASPNYSPKIQKPHSGNEVQNENKELVLYDAKGPSSVNILKQLPNITAKPMNVAKSAVTNVTIQSSMQSTNIQKGKIIQNSVKKIETKQEEKIEIFNIDDSDDEDLPDMPKNQQFNTSLNVNKNYDTTNKAMDVLKHLKNHITIKSKNQPIPTGDDGLQDHDEYSDEELHNDKDHEDGENYEITSQKKLENEVNTLLHNKLKSLGNITMKPRNASSKNMPSSQSSPKVKNKVWEEDYDSDLDTMSKVKITKLPDDYPSDDEDIPLQRIKIKHAADQFNENNSELENDIKSDNETHIEDEDDIERNIKPCTLKKPTSSSNKTPSILNNLKNLTVKSLKETKIDKGDEEFSEDDIKDELVKPNKNQAMQQLRQDTPVDKTVTKPLKQVVRRAMNSNASTSSNQVDTVNKEVTVQTFQSKTVIEEITTTVTKTIRTINQTTNQEVQNMAQKTSMPIRPQKIQGIRPNQQINNYRGMSVRPAAQAIRPRMRNPVIPTRPSIATNLRPSNQLVSVRPGANVARLSNPRMPALKKGPTPSTSAPQKPVAGRPFKISPNAMTPAFKRPASSEASGPFSCFKKPKETLIPDLPSDHDDDNEGESAVKFSASSQVNRSNFMSITKSVKGNSVVTSTQMKSDVSTSSEHLNRLNSMSGLKVFKTSQTKQASKVEERTEVNPAKRNAMDAIEKLQKQGLLVKKPRIEEPLVEEPEDSEHSNPDGYDDDDYYNT